MIQLNATDIFIYGTIWTAATGLIVWFAKDRITSGRDNRKRRRDFRAWLVEFESRVRTEGRYHIIADQWVNQRHIFIGKADELRDAIPRRCRRSYQRLVNRISEMTAGEVDQIERKEGSDDILAGNDRLADTLRDLIRFL